MRALTFGGVGKIVWDAVDDPRIQNDADVIVKVNQCAICGSDLHVYAGREGGLDMNTVMGHEFVGEIVEVGKNVKTLKLGDFVMSPFTTSCGKCFYCTQGLTCRCTEGQLFGWKESGKGLHGGQSEFVRVPLADSTLVRIPDGISNDEALLLGDVMATGFFCARQADIRPNETHAVIGCGPVGLMAILGAIHYGSQKLFAIDTVPERLAMAKRFGAIPINAGAAKPVDVLKEATNGRGADAVLEAVGSAGSVSLAMELIRPGGTISAVGVCNDSHLPFSPAQAYDKNLTYKVGRCPARFMMSQLIPIVQEKKYDVSSIITHRMKLKKGADGYDMFAGRKDNCLKIILEP